MSKSKHPQAVPDRLLAQLTEFTCGGLILFTIDEKGCPHVVCNFENPVAAIALQNHMRYCAEAFERMNQTFAYRALNDGPGHE